MPSPEHAAASPLADTLRIALIGAGNLAHSLGHALRKAGFDIVQIYSRTTESARQLAGQLEVNHYTNLLSQVTCDADLFVMAVPDAVLPQVTSELLEGRTDRLFVHTAGSMPMDVIPAERRGVFYPMQTFSRQRIVDFSEIPLFIEAAREADTSLLRRLAEALGSKVYETSSADRFYLHIAAVFACNFANQCAALAATLLQKHGIPFEVMLPLIDETTRKLHHLSPLAAQTGPAVRNDHNVMLAHLKTLLDDGEPHLASIYQAMSLSIQNAHDQL